MAIEQYTYWSITINNPDENDYLIVRNPNPKYVREMVWTPEIGGEEGTPHIQGWIRLQRNQSQAFVKKIYPRAHLKPCRKDDYNENCHRYAQKNDDTTAGNHHITINDPIPASDTILYKVLEQGFELMMERRSFLRDHYEQGGIKDVIQRIDVRGLYTDIVERDMIMKTAGLEKIFISPAYEKMKSKYWREILIRIYTHKEDADLHDEKTADTSGSSCSEETEVRESVESCSGSEAPGRYEGRGSKANADHDW